MKMLKIVFIGLMIATLMSLTSVAYSDDASAAEYDSGPWTYTTDNNGNAIITRWYWNDPNNGIVDGVLEIPGKIKASTDSVERTVVEFRGPGTSTAYPVSTFFSASCGINEIILPESLKTLSNGAFRECTTLVNIDLSSVTHIGTVSFYECSSLKNVIMPTSTFTFEKAIGQAVPAAGGRAFEKCTSLESVDLTNLKDGYWIRDFDGCSSLYDIKLPSGNYAIQLSGTSIVSIDISKASEVGSFADNRKLKSITMPEVPYTLQGTTFSGCVLLEELDLRNIISIGTTSLSKREMFAPSGIKEFILGPDSPYAVLDGMIVNKAKDTLLFYPSAKAADFRIPDGMIAVGDAAFANTYIETIDLNMVETVGDRAFSDCARLTTVNAPDLITVGEFAFGDYPSIYSRSCKALTTVISPKMKTVGFYAFGDCTALMITDLSSVETAATGSFRGCTSLVTVDVSRLAEIGDTFSGCTSLAGFTALNSEIYSAIDGVLYNKDMDTLVRVPAMWAKTSFKVPEGVTKLGDRVFKEYAALISVDLTDVTEMGIETFYGCTSLETVDITNIVRIGDKAFYRCVALKSIDLSKAGYIGTQTFFGCEALQSVDMVNVTYIGYNAFDGCRSFTKAIAPIAEFVGGSAFSHCDKLLVMDFSNAKHVGTMYDLVNLVSADISSAEYVGGFVKCKSLTYITMPQTPYVIGGEGESTTATEARGFSECDSLTELDLTGLTHMYAYIDCDTFTSIYAPNLIKGMFQCKNVTYMYLPKMTECLINSASEVVIYAPEWNVSGFGGSARALIVSGMKQTTAGIRNIYFVSDYDESKFPGVINAATSIHRAKDATGWDEKYGTFNYVEYRSGNDIVFIDAAPDGERTRQSVFLEEGKIWLLDGEEYNFARLVTSDIILTEGTIVIQAEDTGTDDKDNTMTILAAVASIVGIIVVAVIFILRRPA